MEESQNLLLAPAFARWAQNSAHSYFLQASCVCCSFRLRRTSALLRRLHTMDRQATNTQRNRVVLIVGLQG